MTLVDTSVWVDHLRQGDADLAALLDRSEVLIHPFVIGELACGSLTRRAEVLGALHDLPTAVVADDAEVLAFIETRGLHGKGIGWVDVHLLASVTLTAGATLWTHDKRLAAAARDMGRADPDVDAH